MMITYLELKEQLTEEESAIKQPQQVCLQVVSKEDAISKLLLYEPAFAGLNYVKRLHHCNHDVGGSCDVEPL